MSSPMQSYRSRTAAAQAEFLQLLDYLAAQRETVALATLHQTLEQNLLDGTTIHAFLKYQPDVALTFEVQECGCIYGTLAEAMNTTPQDRKGRLSQAAGLAGVDYALLRAEIAAARSGELFTPLEDYIMSTLPGKTDGDNDFGQVVRRQMLSWFNTWLTQQPAIRLPTVVLTVSEDLQERFEDAE